MLFCFVYNSFDSLPEFRLDHLDFVFQDDITLADLSDHLVHVLPLGVFNLLNVLSIHLCLMLNFAHTLVHVIDFVVRIRGLLQHLPDETLNEVNNAFAGRPHGRRNIVPVIIDD